MKAFKDFKDEIITFELIRYNEVSHDYTALLNEREIIVDPYVGCVWEEGSVKLGVHTFEGFWGSKGAFLPTKEVKKEVD